MSTRWSEATVISIADDVRAQVGADPDGAAGNSSDRILKVARAAGIQLWNLTDWDWRRLQATLTTVADTATVEAPDNFKKFDTKWLKENSDKASLRFYSDVRQYQRIADRCATTTTGTPRAAVVETDADASVYEYRFRLTPTPDAVYTYPYWYVTRDPWTHPDDDSRLLDTESPIWPGAWDEGWRLLATAKAYYQFLPGNERGVGISRSFKAWAVNAIGEVDETITGGDGDDRIEDGYNDEFAFMSNAIYSPAYDDEVLAWLGY